MSGPTLPLPEFRPTSSSSNSPDQVRARPCKDTESTTPTCHLKPSQSSTSCRATHVPVVDYSSDKIQPSSTAQTPFSQAQHCHSRSSYGYFLPLPAQKMQSCRSMSLGIQVGGWYLRSYVELLRSLRALHPVQIWPAVLVIESGVGVRISCYDVVLLAYGMRRIYIAMMVMECGRCILRFVSSE